jgi:aryl-alcohol dehydrogenase-like predicted oxidoreductase
MTTLSVIAPSGTYALGDLTIHRLGFGAMQLTGTGVWGPPRDGAECLRVLRRAVELGVDFIDTADSYGPFISEELIRAALHPYPKGLVIATKAGLLRTGPDRWVPLGRPDYLRQQCEMSLRRLGVERIDLFQLHRIDPAVPADEQFGVLRDLVAEGKVRHLGLSEVTVAEIVRARRIIAVASVQNRFNLIDRSAEPVLTYCAAEGIGFIPWFPLASGQLSRPGGVLDRMASETSHSPSQLALSWLLRRSPVMLPIPGTASVGHLEQNCAAAAIRLSDQQFAALEQAGAKPSP